MATDRDPNVTRPDEKRPEAKHGAGRWIALAAALVILGVLIGWWWAGGDETTVVTPEAPVVEDSAGSTAEPGAGDATGSAMEPAAENPGQNSETTTDTAPQ